MHMSHSYPRLVGLNWDDNSERRDHKCFIIKKGRKKNPRLKQNERLPWRIDDCDVIVKIQTLGGGTRRHWTHLKSVRAVVKQTDREHKASECGLRRLVQVSQAWCVCVRPCDGVNRYKHTHVWRVGLAEFQLSAGENLWKGGSMSQSTGIVWWSENVPWFTRCEALL